MKNIVVVGSINMDIVNEVKKHPLPGETIHGLSTKYYPGGKGANQAVAAARSGGTTMMVGAVGEDAFSSELIASLADSGVNAEQVSRVPGNSGIAFITVDESGENSIILSAGANRQVRLDDRVESLNVLHAVDIVLLQNEIPWETNREVMKRACSQGARVLYNPAPAMKIPADVYPYIHTLILNETEIEVITGMPIGDDSLGAEAAIDSLLDAGIQSVILTLGSKGCLYKAAGSAAVSCPAFRVEAVDTTAAGDTFIGAFASSLAEGRAIPEGLRFASAAAAIAVTGEGAQASIPTREQIDRFLQSRA
ncbi:ribokinase [Cohnella sp. GCM10027633]|uniref:ribokinase n=1 Tax=unclassified Cohnella TaxID=2636738 RepID=UPI00362B797A